FRQTADDAAGSAADENLERRAGGERAAVRRPELGFGAGRRGRDPGEDSLRVEEIDWPEGLLVRSEAGEHGGGMPALERGRIRVCLRGTIPGPPDLEERDGRAARAVVGGGRLQQPREQDAPQQRARRVERIDDCHGLASELGAAEEVPERLL